MTRLASESLKLDRLESISPFGVWNICQTEQKIVCHGIDQYSCCSVCGRTAMARRESSVGTKMLSCLVIAARRLSGLRLIVVPVDCMEVIR